VTAKIFEEHQMSSLHSNATNSADESSNLDRTS